MFVYSFSLCIDKCLEYALWQHVGIYACNLSIGFGVYWMDGTRNRSSLVHFWWCSPHIFSTNTVVALDISFIFIFHILVTLRGIWHFISLHPFFLIHSECTRMKRSTLYPSRAYTSFIIISPLYTALSQYLALSYSSLPYSLQLYQT